MCDGLELIAKIGTARRMQRPRAVECLKIVLGEAAWVRAAQSRPELLAALRALLAENEPLLALLERTLPPEPSGTGKAPAPPAAAATERSSNVEQLLTAGR